MQSLFWETALSHHIELHHVVVAYGNLYDHFPSADGEFRSLSEVTRTAARTAGFPEVHTIGIDDSGCITGAPDFDQIRCSEHDAPACWVVGNAQVPFANTGAWVARDWEEHDRLLRKLHQSHGRHRFVILFPEEGRIPAPFLRGCPGVSRFPIPMPEQTDRRNWAEVNLSSQLEDPFGVLDREQLSRITGTTEGLHWQDLQVLARVAEQEHSTKIDDLVRRFKFGDSRNYWGELLGDRDRLVAAHSTFVDPGNEDAIFGQDEAVEKALQVVSKACLGLGEVTTPGYNRPRGVLFFVGPTGVGKTMLAKKLAGLIFGTQENCLVLDMSEYSQPQSEARLVGAPPGYVGHEDGGQLTRAMRSRPFRVVLFDEIDKADESILTKFLQILDEGRLTDGKGQSCHFSDALVIFTSNAGALELPVDNGTVSVHRDSAIEVLSDYYVEHLKQAGQFAKRPEILSRVGLANVVPFRHIAARGHVEHMARGLFNRLRRRFEEHDVPLHIADEEEARLVAHVVENSAWQDFGMRNVRQTMESLVVEPLAQAMIANRAKEPMMVTLCDERVEVVGYRQ